MEIIDLSITLDTNVNASELEIIAQQTFELVSNSVQLFLPTKPAEIRIWIEQGSVNRKIKVVAALGGVYAFICSFGSFVTGVEDLIKYSNKAVNYITKEIVEPTSDKVTQYKKSKTDPERIKGIIQDVQMGKYTASVATDKIMRMVSKEDSDLITKERFTASFNETAENVFRQPVEQLMLFSNDEVVDDNILVELNTKTPISKRLPMKPKEIPSLLGVELWFDFKNGKKHVKHYTK